MVPIPLVYAYIFISSKKEGKELEKEKNPLIRFVFRMDEKEPIKEAETLPRQDADLDEKNPLVRLVFRMDE